MVRVRFICCETEAEAGLRAAEIMAEVIRENPMAIIGLATGSTPLNMYSALADMYDAGEISFAGVKSVNLDEYVGLPPCHNRSYAYFMSENLFSKIDIPRENTHIPDGMSDPDLECENYNQTLDRLGPVDIQLLGIGHNGHIAFNEPDSYFLKDTSCVRLTDSTIKANSRFFDSEAEVPKMAISMGIGRILRSRRILLLAMGEGKAMILEKALFGRVTPSVPASILQFYQGELTVVADRSAMSVICEKHPYVIEKM